MVKRETHLYLLLPSTAATPNWLLHKTSSAVKQLQLAPYITERERQLAIKNLKLVMNV